MPTSGTAGKPCIRRGWQQNILVLLGRVFNILLKQPKERNCNKSTREAEKCPSDLWSSRVSTSHVAVQEGGMSQHWEKSDPVILALTWISSHLYPQLSDPCGEKKTKDTKSECSWFCAAPGRCRDVVCNSPISSGRWDFKTKPGML